MGGREPVPRINTLISIIVLAVISCGQDLDRRNEPTSADATSNTSSLELKELSVYLPDRKPLLEDIESANELLNSYYIKLSPQGESCTQTESLESSGGYEDRLKLSFQLSEDCDYLIDMLVFENKSSALNLSSSLNFEDSISSIFQSKCVSCHTGYDQFSTIQGNLDNIVLQVENGTMPPTGSTALTDFEIATIIAWKAGGYVEKNPNPITEESPLANSLGTYYRNNFNTKISSAQIKSQNFIIYEDSLWLQAEGQAVGFQQVEWKVVGDAEDESSNP